VLEVEAGSSLAVARTAWHRAAKRWHPDDGSGGDVDRFVAARQAWAAIRDGVTNVDIATPWTARADAEAFDDLLFSSPQPFAPPARGSAVPAPAKHSTEAAAKVERSRTFRPPAARALAKPIAALVFAALAFSVRAWLVAALSWALPVACGAAVCWWVLSSFRAERNGSVRGASSWRQRRIDDSTSSGRRISLRP
jgi:hypothetical protein